MLVFSIDRGFAWSVGFDSSKWELRKGDGYPVSLRVDGAPAFSETAVAVTSHLAEVPLADSTALSDAFKQGNLLTVYAAGQTFRFDLTGTSTLLDCVKAFNDRDGAAASTSISPGFLPGLRFGPRCFGPLGTKGLLAPLR